MAYHVLFSEARIALNREASKHPKLMEDLQYIDPNDFPATVAEIAAYCNVTVDGDYYDVEIDKLCDILTTKLRAVSSLIVV